MGDLREKELEDWLSERGYTHPALIQFVRLCLAEKGAHTAQLSVIVSQLAEEDRCASVHEWLEAAESVPSSSGISLETLDYEGIQEFRRMIRTRQLELYPWRSDDLSESRREFLEGGYEAHPEDTDDA